MVGPGPATVDVGGEHEPVAHRVGGANLGPVGEVRAPEPAGSGEPAESGAPAESGESGGEPDEESDDSRVDRDRRAGALLVMRVTLPFVAAAPAAFVLGRIFVG